jgi:hypothetical protein
METALADVFPWARHLSIAERSEFTADLITELSDAGRNARAKFAVLPVVPRCR